MQFRNLTTSDLDRCLFLCRTAGWNQTAAEWKFFLRANPSGCFGCVDLSGKLVGTVTTLRYQDRFSWIGMVLVDPEHQKLGIGSALMEQALNFLKDDRCIALDATAEGRKVYLKFGFEDVTGVSRMLMEGGGAERIRDQQFASPLAPGDWPELTLLDRRAFGADRQELLRWQHSNHPELSFVIHERGAVAAFSMGRIGHNFVHLGPVVAANPDQAKCLIASGLRVAATAGVIIDIFDHHQELGEWLQRSGFARHRSLIRMSKGDPLPLEGSRPLTILGPEFG